VVARAHQRAGRDGLEPELVRLALELLAAGAWSGTGVLGPEAFPAQPFLDLLDAYGSPHGVMELPA